LYTSQADRLENDGYNAAGYGSIHFDDCWTAMERDSKTKRLVANDTRFPSGISALTEYVHSLGLKFAIYADFGTKTCGGYPGSMGYEKIDSDTFAEWKVDYLKLDGCNSSPEEQAKGYPLFTKTLNATGRPIVYSCSWPAYQNQSLINYTLLGDICNLWRDFDDINSSWKSIFSIINHYIQLQDLRAKTQGPGKWHDPDMLVIGNDGITEGMSRIQMTVWSIWSAPLIMSNDLRTIAPEFRNILQNRKVIAIDQDPLGAFGKMVKNTSQLYYFVKPVTPHDGGSYSYAIAIINYSAQSAKLSFVLEEFGLKHENGYDFECLWEGKKVGHHTPKDIFNATVSSLDAKFFKATIKQHISEDELKKVRESFAAGFDF